MKSYINIAVNSVSLVKTVLGIHDILVRIRIRESVPLAYGSESNFRSDPSFSDFKDAKKNSPYLPEGKLSSV
jgi:hypothetical protein